MLFKSWGESLKTQLFEIETNSWKHLVWVYKRSGGTINTILFISWQPFCSMLYIQCCLLQVRIFAGPFWIPTFFNLALLNPTWGNNEETLEKRTKNSWGDRTVTTSPPESTPDGLIASLLCCTLLFVILFQCQLWVKSGGYVW